MASAKHLALGGFATLLGLAAIWLYVQTRARPQSAEPAPAPAPAAAPAAPAVVVGEARDAGAPAVTLGVTGIPIDAAGAASTHQSVAEREVARAQRTKWVQRAIASHPVHEKWTAAAQALIDQVGQRAEHVDDTGCFVIGCTGTFTFATRAAYDDAYRELTTTPAYETWHSGKRWTTPEEQDDGRVIVALVLYRID
jgi:hypothetical protein